ncbi:MAG TPA: hypothetical protein P5048_02025 [Chlamydiales bacterium]|nr:hypothetical protein [Chlamydiales bacterium]
MIRKLFSFFAFLLCVSCGYHLSDSFVAISIPFIEGDEKGALTQQLISEVVKSPLMTYQPSSQTQLQIKIISVENEQIGYKRDRNPDGTVRKDIMPIEGRQTIIADISLIDLKKGDSLIEKRRITAYADYDFVEQNSIKDLSFIDQNNQREKIIQFSLGQLESKAEAQEASLMPLYKALSKKIIHSISQRYEDH